MAKRTVLEMYMSPLVFASFPLLKLSVACSSRRALSLFFAREYSGSSKGVPAGIGFVSLALAIHALNAGLN
jgi:hypothetical protein